QQSLPTTGRSSSSPRSSTGRTRFAYDSATFRRISSAPVITVSFAWLIVFFRWRYRSSTTAPASTHISGSASKNSDRLAVMKEVHGLTADEKRAAEIFRALGNPARVRIVTELAKRGCTTGALVELLPLAQSTVSQHLRVLKD